MHQEDTPSNKDIAAAYCFALREDWVGVEGALAWVDSVIRRFDEPDIEFIDIAYLGKGHRFQIASKLSKIRGESDPQVVRSLLFRLLKRQVELGVVTPSQASRKLYRAVANYEKLWGKHYVDVVRIDDDLDLAEEGIYGALTVADVEKKLVSFLEREAPLKLNGSLQLTGDAHN